MWSIVVVVLDELVDSSAKFIHCICRINVYVFLLDSTPEAFSHYKNGKDKSLNSCFK